MRQNAKRPAALLIITALLLGLAGCAGAGRQGDLAGSEYKRILELQRGKAQFAAREDARLENENSPEMNAPEFERLGDQYARQGNAMMALVQYQKVLQTEPEKTSVHAKLGLLFLSKGLNAEAKKEFSFVLSKEPLSAVAHEGMGRILIAEGDLQNAQKSLSQALVLDPKLWQAHMLLGVIHDRFREYDAAIAQYSAALALKPGSPVLLNNLAMSYYAKGDYARAEEMLNSALQHEPSNTTWNNLGLVLGKQGRYDQALEAFTSAGDEAGAYNNIGMVYMSQEKYHEALTAFRKAFALKPQYYAKAQENIRKAEAALKKRGEE